MDVESFIISAVITIVLLCVAFGTRTLIRKHRKKKGKLINNSNSKKEKAFTNIVMILSVITIGVGVYSFICLKSYHPAQIYSAAAQMANSNLRQYEGRIRGSTVKDLFSFVDAINAQEVYPMAIEFFIFNDKPINNNDFYYVSLLDTDDDIYYNEILVFPDYIKLGYKVSAKNIEEMITGIAKNDSNVKIYYDNQKVNIMNYKNIDLVSNIDYTVTTEDTDNDGYFDSIYIDKINQSIPSILYSYKHSDYIEKIEHIDKIKFYINGKSVQNALKMKKLSDELGPGLIYNNTIDEDKDGFGESIYFFVNEERLSLYSLMLLGPQFYFDLKCVNAINLFVICLLIGLLGIMVYYILDIQEIKDKDRLLINIENLIYILLSIIVFVVTFVTSGRYHSDVLEIIRGIWIIDIIAILITLF